MMDVSTAVFSLVTLITCDFDTFRWPEAERNCLGMGQSECTGETLSQNACYIVKMHLRSSRAVYLVDQIPVIVS